jgi:hypothetical protein
MKRITSLAFMFALIASLGGCFVSTHSNGRGRSKSGCGPAHHMENGYCVHNGNGAGNGNGKGRGNRK